MKKLLLAALFLASSCVTQEEDYQKVKEVAAKQTSKSDEFGFGFKAGMSKPEVTAQLGKLAAGTTHNGINLPISGWYKAEIEPAYAKNKLAVLEVSLKGIAKSSEFSYQELIDMLNTRYGKHSYRHRGTLQEDKAQSWFNGPIEIEAEYDDVLGMKLTYRDLRLQDQYINDSVDTFLREEEAEKIRNQEQAKRL